MRKKVLKLKEEVKRNAIGCVLNMVVFLLCALLLFILFLIPIKTKIIRILFYIWMNREKHIFFSAFVIFIAVGIWLVLYGVLLYGGLLCFVRSFKFLKRCTKSKKLSEAERAIKRVAERAEERAPERRKNKTWNFFLNEVRKNEEESIKEHKQL